MKLHFCGPGDIKIEPGLPPGTETFQLETAPSGHLVLPCCEYEDDSSKGSSTLTLVARQASSGSESRSAAPAVVPPPPPPEPPVLTGAMLTEHPRPTAPAVDLSL